MIPVKLAPRGLAPLIAGFALLFVIVGCAIWLSIQEDNVTFWVRHTLQVENRLSRVQSLATDAETGQRGYLLTAREAYLAPYQYARQTLIPEIDALAKQTADNQSQQELIVALRSTVSSKLAELQSTIDLRAAGHPDQAAPWIDPAHRHNARHGDRRLPGPQHFQHVWRQQSDCQQHHDPAIEQGQTTHVVRSETHPEPAEAAGEIGETGGERIRQDQPMQTGEA